MRATADFLLPTFITNNAVDKIILDCVKYSVSKLFRSAGALRTLLSWLQNEFVNKHSTLHYLECSEHETK